MFEADSLFTAQIKAVGFSGFFFVSFIYLFKTYYFHYFESCVDHWAAGEKLTRSRGDFNGKRGAPVQMHFVIQTHGKPARQSRRIFLTLLLLLGCICIRP